MAVASKGVAGRLRRLASAEKKNAFSARRMALRVVHRLVSAVSRWRFDLGVQDLAQFKGEGRQVTPKIRLTGKWLEQAGFKPGHRVELDLVDAGVLTLRFVETAQQFAP
jgi:hypothetical protein